MGRKRFSPEQIIVKLREAEIIESKGLTQVEAASFNIALSRLKSATNRFNRTLSFSNFLNSLA